MSNILLVEDSATQAMQMKLLLESADHTVTCVDDGTVALERLADGFNPRAGSAASRSLPTGGRRPPIRGADTQSTV